MLHVQMSAFRGIYTHPPPKSTVEIYLILRLRSYI